MSDAANHKDDGLTADRPIFKVGDSVVDRDDDASVARVLDPDVGRADQVVVSGSGETVDELNQEYPATDRVVKVAFESDLQVLPDYESGTIAEQVSRFASEWGVEIRTYSYPESRLVEVGARPATPDS